MYSFLKAFLVLIKVR